MNAEDHTPHGEIASATRTARVDPNTAKLLECFVHADGPAKSD